MRSLSFVLALALILALAVPAGAAGNGSDVEITWLSTPVDLSSLGFSEEPEVYYIKQFDQFCICISATCYLMDRQTGDAVTTDQYDCIYPFSDGLARVGKADMDGYMKYGYIDEFGEIVIPLEYDHAEDFSNGLACISDWDWMSGYIDKTGQTVIPLEYDYAESFSGDLAHVEKIVVDSYKAGYINKSGEEVIPLEYDAARSFSEGLALVEKTDANGDQSIGYIDQSGELVIPLEYDSADDFSDGIALVKQYKADFNGWFTSGNNFNAYNCGYIDKTGKLIVPLEYDDAKSFSDGLACVGMADADGFGTGKYGYINAAGEVVIPLEYRDADNFSGGLAAVSKYLDDGTFQPNPDLKYGCIDVRGQTVVPFAYDRCGAVSDGNGPDRGRFFYVIEDSRLGIFENPYYSDYIDKMPEPTQVTSVDTGSASEVSLSSSSGYTTAPIEDIQALCEQGEYEQAYEMIRSLPPCAETAALLKEMIAVDLLDMDTIRAAYKENSVRAEKEYGNKFYFIPGKVAGFDTALLGGQYMRLDIDGVSDEGHCFDIEEEELMSVNNGEDVIVAGHYDASWVWEVIDFRSCSIVDPAYLNATESIAPVKESNEDEVFSAAGGSSAFNFCPNCGEPLVTNGKFCPYCGTQLYEMSETPSAEAPQNDPVAVTAPAAPDEWYKAYEEQPGYYLDIDTGWTLEISYEDGEIVSVSDEGGFLVNWYDSEAAEERDGGYVYSSLDYPGDEYMELRYDQTDGSLTTMDEVYLPMTGHGDKYTAPRSFDKNWYQADGIYERSYSGPYGTLIVSGTGDLICVETDEYGSCTFDANDHEGAVCRGVYYSNDEGKELYYYPDFQLILFVDSSGGALVCREDGGE